MPLSVRPPVDAIVGQPAAGVTVGVVVGVGVGEGDGVGRVMLTSPLVPGETISSPPQPARARVLTPITRVRWMFFTACGPLSNRESKTLSNEGAPLR